MGVSFENQVTPFFLLFFLSLSFFSPLSRKGEQRLTEAGKRGEAEPRLETGGPALSGTKGARGPCAPPPSPGKPGASSGEESRWGCGARVRLMGAGSFRSASEGRRARPLPSQRWQAGCVLHLCIFKVGRWAWNKHPRRALNSKSL